MVAAITYFHISTDSRQATPQDAPMAVLYRMDACFVSVALASARKEEPIPAATAHTGKLCDGMHDGVVEEVFTE